MMEFILSTALLFGDWGQTRTILDSPNYYETNQYITKDNVNIVFGSAIALNASVWLLPKNYRKAAWVGVGLTEIVFVSGNAGEGIGFNFKF